MDKICRGSRVGEVHQHSPRAAGHSMLGTPKIEASTPKSRNSGSKTDNQRLAATPHQQSRALPRHESQAAGQRSSQRPAVQSPPNAQLRESRSAWALGRASEGMHTPRSSRTSPRCSPASPPPPLPQLDFGVLSEPAPAGKGIARMRSEPGWLSPRGLQASASIDCVSPRRRNTEFSPREYLFSEEHEPSNQQRGRRCTDSAASPGPDHRALSPTFQSSKDFCLQCPSSPRCEEGSSRGAVYTMTADKGFPTPFSPRRLRQQSGRITENSVNFLQHEEENTTPVPTVITNSEDYKISRGKKTGYKREQEHVKGRLSLDMDQQDTDLPSTQRRHDFTKSLSSPRTTSQSQQQSPRLGCGLSKSNSHASAFVNVGMQHQTSGDMAASIRPDVTSQQSQKYFVGNEIVDWQNSGRRGLAACARHAAQTGALVRSPVSVIATPRDQRSSEGMREQFQHQKPVVVQASVPVVYASPPVVAQSMPFAPCTSIMPSSTSKDTAYLHGGLKVVKYSPRASGQFSPNVPRAPVSTLMKL
mmetsp:Transcript_70952/g.178938  ORF Transcript_70952/g.178938 Transcript_70952/m.178938 type:complete len:530 (-) Transcript_70952:148-1737(-)